MSMHDHLARRNKGAPQSKRAREDQVENHANGFVFKLDPWASLDRFLILGTDGGTYYANERQSTLEISKPVLHCISENGVKVVNRIVEISDAGRAVRNDSAILLLALCLTHGDNQTKQAAVLAVPKICRIGTHILMLAKILASQRGWGRVAQKAIKAWFMSKDTDSLAYQAVKYKQRDGWSMRDLLRVSHYKVRSDNRNAVLSYMARPAAVDMFYGESPLLAAVTDLANLAGEDRTPTKVGISKAAQLIAQYNIPREAVPTQLLKEPLIWEALLEQMPLTALIRNLGRLSGDLGIIRPLGEAAGDISARIVDEKALKQARVHPLTLLNAYLTYSQGGGTLGSLKWKVAPEIAEALQEAYFKAFQYVEPTGKRFYLGIDVSGSMGWSRCAGTNITPAQGAACMAQVTNVVEPKTYVAGFCHEMVELPMPKQPVLSGGFKAPSFGRTDCAAPMLDALKNGIEADVFVVYTDNETWAGRIHPYQALREYRDRTGINAKLVVVGMTATQFSIADPRDAGMLDVVGFDTNTPSAISAFAVG